MSTFESRKHANVPTGYVAVYGQNGITYKKATQPAARKSSSCLPCLIVLALVVLTAVVIFANLTVWEDGSFRLFDFVGCLPGGWCNL